MKRIPLLLVVILLLAACRKETPYSNVPEVAFQSFTVYRSAATGKDSALDFIFTFKDGDGDIGYQDFETDDTCGNYKRDLFIRYEQKKNGVFVPKKIWQKVYTWDSNCHKDSLFDSVQVAFNQRLQYVQPNGNNKSIDGTVTYHMDYVSALVLLSSSGRFVFYINDRAGHKSNEVTTPELDLVK